MNNKEYLDRMREEEWNLADKITRAEIWLSDSTNGDEAERNMLNNQLFHMRAYRDILVERILYANKKEK